MTTETATASPEDGRKIDKSGVTRQIESIRGKTKKKLKVIFSPDLLIKKNGLNLSLHGNSYLCKELFEVQDRFDELHSPEEKRREMEDDINGFIQQVGKGAKLRRTSESDKRSEEELENLGKEIFDTELAKLQQATSSFSPLKKLLFWLGDYWWYYNTEFRAKITVSNPDKKLTSSIAKKYLFEALPETIKESVGNMRIANVAVGYGHFAILFVDGDKNLRRIVTDSQLFELRGVYGYSYLDITPEGKPIARSVCNQGGERCFFDGERLMAHDKFQTCAPKTTIIDGGYKVNSTRCTIVNGKLCELIDVDDSVAYTTGAFMGHCDFSTQEALKSFKMNEESANNMKVRNGEITLNGEKIKPVGIFSPSNTKLLENGFTLFEFSDFHEIDNYIYNKVMIVDDKADFIRAASEKLKGVPRLSSLATSSKKDALDNILNTDPEAVLLDMHLTEGEEFDGLWIANELESRGFKGEIMLISGYGRAKLEAMRVLIKKSGVHVPGKDLKKIDSCLYGKCDCL